MTQNQNNCAVTHLGGRYTSAFVIPSAAIARSLSSTLVASTVLWRPHKDSDLTAVIAIVDWRLHAKTHGAGEVVSTVISSCLTLDTIADSTYRSTTEHGPHVTCALIGMSCNTERLRVQRVATVSNAATRSAVAPRNKQRNFTWGYVCYCIIIDNVCICKVVCEFYYCCLSLAGPPHHSPVSVQTYL